MTIHIAITGASGTIYAARLLERLSVHEQVEQVFLTMTATAQKVALHELGEKDLEVMKSHPKVQILANDNYFVSVASGSAAPEAMVVVPCSMGMIGRIAHGISNDLISRSADVMLKEERRLILVPRETPLSLIHLQNLVTLKQSGATILPANPSLYSNPQTITQLIDTVVDRIIDQLSLESNHYRWKG